MSCKFSELDTGQGRFDRKIKNNARIFVPRTSSDLFEFIQVGRSSHLRGRRIFIEWACFFFVQAWKGTIQDGYISMVRFCGNNTAGCKNMAATSCWFSLYSFLPLHDVRWQRLKYSVPQGGRGWNGRSVAQQGLGCCSSCCESVLTILRAVLAPTSECGRQINVVQGG